MNPEEIFNNAVAAMGQGDLDKAASLFEEVISLRKSVSPAYSNLTLAYLNQGNYRQAEETCRKMIENIPNSPDISDTYNLLGASLREQNRLDEAVEVLQKSITLCPDDVKYYGPLGVVLQEMGKYAEAEEIYKKVIEIDPKSLQGYKNVVFSLNSQGKKKELNTFLEKAVQLFPFCTLWHVTLSREKRYIKDDPHIIAMENILDQKKLDQVETGQIYMALGNAYGNLRDYGRSFANYKKGNDLVKTGSEHDFDEDKKLFIDAREAGNKAFLEKHHDSGITDFSPIFIVGMPRSGTSLLEQILASHPDVYGAGELAYINESKDLHDFLSDEHDRSAGVLTPENIKEMAEHYKEKVERFYTDKKIIVDKMPQNFLYIPMIKAMFPDAKIINCKRDPMDNCFSLYKIFFSAGIYYSYDFNDMAAFYRLYERLMEYYHKLMPEFILDVVYEDVVEDLEGQTRKLLEFCNLSWDPRCLSFYKTEREVITASSLQVKEPLYNSSVGAWKKYEEYLGPLRKAVEGEMS